MIIGNDETSCMDVAEIKSERDVMMSFMLENISKMTDIFKDAPSANEITRESTLQNLLIKEAFKIEHESAIEVILRQNVMSHTEVANKIYDACLNKSSKFAEFLVATNKLPLGDRECMMIIAAAAKNPDITLASRVAAKINWDSPKTL